MPSQILHLELIFGAKKEAELVLRADSEFRFHSGPLIPRAAKK